MSDLRRESHLMRVATDAVTAGRLADAFSEWFGAAVAAFEQEGGWSVEIHFENEPDQDQIRSLVQGVAGDTGVNALRFETLAPHDWVKSSLEGLKPVHAGRFVVHGAHDRPSIRPPRIGIEIEAALAFGTGHHGTTHGCLIALDCLSRAMRPRRILDIGTGTGVLAIAAAKGLRQRVLASDIDDRAVRIAIENARHNGAAGFIEVVRAPGLTAPRIRARAPFDLVFANILLPTLRLLARPLAQLLAPQACIVLSGLLSAQSNAALAVYRAQGLRLRRQIVLEGWTTLVLERAAPIKSV
jgi:ribosomal protein L11 methyltransferase